MGILDTNHLSCCGIVRYYPKFPPMIVLSALLCKRDRVHFFSSCASGKQRLTMFDPCCRVAMLGVLWSLAIPVDMLDAGKVPAGGRYPFESQWLVFPDSGKRPRGWTGAVRLESMPGPAMSREWLGWGGFSCSAIRARTTMRMAEKNPGTRRSVSGYTLW